MCVCVCIESLFQAFFLALKDGFNIKILLDFNIRSISANNIGNLWSVSNPNDNVIKS